MTNADQITHRIHCPGGTTFSRRGARGDVLVVCRSCGKFAVAPEGTELPAKVVSQPAAEQTPEAPQRDVRHSVAPAPAPRPAPQPTPEPTQTDLRHVVAVAERQGLPMSVLDRFGSVRLVHTVAQFDLVPR